ncbi:MAG: glycosyltransferase family A protein, partial [Pseudomonadota bacterium]
MLYRLRRQLARRRFEQSCRSVRVTPPLRPVPAPVTILSMVSHADVIMYLIAIKSLYRRLGRGNILIIDDGSLTDDDRDFLSEHLARPKIVPLSALDTGRCPRGGTWERLLLILEISADEYVIQLDSDTLAQDRLDEVVDCIESNRAFTLGTRMGQRFDSLSDAAARIADLSGDHVQMVAERALARFDSLDQRRYVRGSSGFAGFARGGFGRAQLEAFSVQMRGLIGDKWTEWGSEQVASNFVVANSSSARILPYPKYACFDLRMDPRTSAFLAFHRHQPLRSRGLCRARQSSHEQLRP